MAGSKDNAVVAVISDLTPTQAAKISSVIIEAKEKIAPFSRGTMGVGKQKNVGALLQKGVKKIGGK